MLDNETQFKQVMIKAQAGDSGAYSELLLGLVSFLKNYLKRRIFDKNEIEEVIQEILLALHKSLHTYDSEKSFMSWLMSIVEYKIIDYIRALQKHKSVNIESIPNIFASMNTDSDLKLDLEKAISGLSSREQNILTRLKVEGHSINEVAKQLKLSGANVKVIAHRAYLNLKKQFGAGS